MPEYENKLFNSLEKVSKNVKVASGAKNKEIEKLVEKKKCARTGVTVDS